MRAVTLAIVVLLLAALSVPVASAGEVSRYDAIAAGPVFGDDGVAWLSFATGQEVCDGSPSAQIAHQDVTVRTGVVVSMARGEVPFVVMGPDADPCVDAPVLSGTATMHYQDNDAQGSGTRGNSFGVGFRGTGTDGRKVSGHIRLRISKAGEFTLVNTRMAIGG